MASRTFLFSNKQKRMGKIVNHDGTHQSHDFFRPFASLKLLSVPRGVVHFHIYDRNDPAKEAEKLAGISQGIFGLIRIHYEDLDLFEDLVGHVRYRRSQFNLLYLTRLELMTGGSTSVIFIASIGLVAILILRSLYN
jgi:hypothetical protein